MGPELESRIALASNDERLKRAAGLLGLAGSTDAPEVASSAWEVQQLLIAVREDHQISPEEIQEAMVRVDKDVREVGIDLPLTQLAFTRPPELGILAGPVWHS